MEMNRDYKPELIFDKDRKMEPYLDIEVDAEGKRTGRIMATDGKRMMVIPVELDDADVSGQIPVAVFKAARAVNKTWSAVTIYCDATAFKLRDGTTMPRHEGGKSLQWRQVIPTYPGTHEVKLNPELLLSLAKAMGSPEEITIRVTEKKNMLLLVGKEAGVEHAVLMGMY